MASDFVIEVNENIKLIQDKDGLKFGTDAFLLYAFLPYSKKIKAVEFGAGTGIISLLCASKGKLTDIDALEVQDSFYHILSRNITANNLNTYIHPLCMDVRDYNNQADIIFTNPPYLKTNHGKANYSDKKNIARHEVMGDIYDFCRSAKKILKFGGDFYCVYRCDRLCDLIDAMRKNDIEPKLLTMVYPDELHSPCMALIRGKHGGRPGLEITPPVIMYENGTSLPTQQLKQIYSNGEILW